MSHSCRNSSHTLDCNCTHSVCAGWLTPRAPSLKPTHTHTHACTHASARTHACMLILQGMGEFRASLISSAGAYHPEPEWVGRIDGGAGGRWETGKTELGNGRCVGPHKGICFAQSSSALCTYKKNTPQCSKATLSGRREWLKGPRGRVAAGRVMEQTIQGLFPHFPFKRAPPHPPSHISMWPRVSRMLIFFFFFFLPIFPFSSTLNLFSL